MKEMLNKNSTKIRFLLSCNPNILKENWKENDLLTWWLIVSGYHAPRLSDSQQWYEPLLGNLDLYRLNLNIQSYLKCGRQIRSEKSVQKSITQGIVWQNTSGYIVVLYSIDDFIWQF